MLKIHIRKLIYTRLFNGNKQKQMGKEQLPYKSLIICDFYILLRRCVKGVLYIRNCH